MKGKGQMTYQPTFGITSNEHDTWIEPELAIWDENGDLLPGEFEHRQAGTDGPWSEVAAAADIAELEADPYPETDR
jgi:hypothetical protein